MNEQTAAEVIRRANSVTAQLDDMVRLILESGSEDEEFSLYRRRIGRVMGELHDEVLKPLFETFPHLIPPERVPPKR
ncbi:MAG TPA: hypothetical protein VHX64_05125 [Caulobacteraceae bacterium]|nr:hypothetical protein [Caulobacteraceae bacterium]